MLEKGKGVGAGTIRDNQNRGNLTKKLKSFSLLHSHVNQSLLIFSGSLHGSCRGPPLLSNGPLYLDVSRGSESLH